jgi:hypothetical protein
MKHINRFLRKYTGKYMSVLHETHLQLFIKRTRDGETENNNAENALRFTSELEVFKKFKKNEME